MNRFFAFIIVLLLSIPAKGQTAFITGNITVLQVNDTTSAADSVCILEYSPSLLHQTTPVSGHGLPSTMGIPLLTLSGASTSDGQMTLDSERLHLIVSGYYANQGTANVTSAASIARVIFSFTPAGVYSNVANVLETSAFNGNNFRSATAAAARYYGAGNGSGSTNGIQLMSGSTSSRITSTVSSTRVVNIFNGQLYFSTSSGTGGIYSVGTGVPTATGITSTALGGVTVASPYGFALSPDNNTLYVAADSAGLLKFTRTGGSGSFAGPTVVNAIFCRGLTVDFSTTPYTLYATTSGISSGANALVKIVDGSSTIDTLASAPIHKILKGVAFSPTPNAFVRGGGDTICSGNSELLRFYGNPGDSVTYTLNGITAGVRLNNAGVDTINTGALTAGVNDSIYTWSIVNAVTSIGTTARTGTVSIVVRASAVSPIVGLHQLCNTLGLTLSDSTAGGSWSSSATGVATVNTSGFVSSVGPGTAIITYSRTSSCGTLSDTSILTVIAQPSAGIITGSTNMCSGSGITLSDLVSGGTWSSSATGVATVGTSGFVTSVTPGTSIISYTYTNFCGSATDTQMVRVNAIPSVTVTPVSSTICSGQATSISASGATTYSWAPTTGLSASTGASVNFTGTTTTTYTVTGTTAGCNGTHAQTITVNPTPTVTVTPVASTICTGQSTSITASGATTYTWAPSTGLSATTGVSVNFTGTTSTTYTVTGTTTGCNGTNMQTITVNTTPTVTVTPVCCAILCSGQSTSITASGATTYTWAPSTGISATTGTMVNFTGTTTTTYTVTGTTNGCNGTRTQTMTVNPTPTITITPVSSTICSGQSTSVTASGAATYSWSPAASLSATTGTSVNFTGTTSATITVTGNSAGCNGSNTQTITVNTTPTVSVTPVSATICNGQSTSITAGGAASYSWSPSTGLSATTGSSVNFTGTTTGTYTVTGTTTGCNATNTQTITVNPIPTVTVTPVSATICSGQSTSITASGATTYSWSPTVGLSATTGASVNFTGTNTATYTVTGTSTGCNGINTQTIVVNTTPTISVTPTSATICSGQSTSITASGATTYSWSPSTGLSATTGAAVNFTGAASTTYTVTGTSTGCSANNTQTITVNPTPTVSVTPVSATICSGQATSITASGATTYSWAPATGISATTGASVNFSGTNTATYTVTGTSTGCNGTNSQTITVNPTPTITVTPVSATICSGQSSSMSASGATTYIWSPSAGLSATTGASVNFTGTGTTTYTVTGTTSGCDGINTQTITVNTTPTVTVSPIASTICSGQSTSITAGGATTYSWSPAAGLSATTGASVNFTGTSTATYTVTGTSTGCNGTNSQTITVNPTPTITVTPVASTICSGQSTSLTGSGATSYSWSPSTGLSATTGASVNFSGTTSASYTVTGTTLGCDGTTTQTITVNPTPTITVTSVTSIYCAGSSTSISATGADTYSWSPATGLTATTGATINCAATANTTYTITGTSLGCSSSTTQGIVVDTIPVIHVTPVASSLCTGSTTSITASGADTYSWSPSIGLSASTGSSVNFIGATTTTYTITGTTADNCHGVDTQTITVGASPVIHLTAATGRVCRGSATTLFGTGGSTYTWSPSTGLGATTGPMVTCSPSVATTYTVTGSSGPGCSGTDTLTVYVDTIPVISLSSLASSICVGSGTSITASGADTYVWSPVGSLSGTTGTTLACNPTVTTTYSVSGTDLATCHGANTITIHVDTPLVLSIAPHASNICAGAPATLFASGASAYTWTTSYSTSDTGATYSLPTTLLPDIYTFTVTATNGACTSSTSTTDTVRATPLLSSTTTPASICGGSIFDYTPTSATSVATFAWSRAVVPGISNPASSGSGDPMETLVNTTADSLQVTYIDTVSAYGCASTQAVSVWVKALPTLTSTLAPANVCDSSTFTYIATTGTAGTSFNWGRTTVAVIVGSGANGTGSISEMLVNNGLTPVTVVYSDTLSAAGCSNVQSVSAVVNPLPVLSSTLSPAAICSGSPFTYIPTSESTPVTYTWSRAGISGISNPSAHGAGTITETLVDTTGLPVAVTYMDTLHINGCINVQSVTVTVNPAALLVSSLVNTPICDSSFFHYVPVTSLPGTNITWSRPAVAGITVAAATGIDSVFELLVNTTASPINVIYHDTLNYDGCINVQDVSVTVNPRLVLSSTLTPPAICDSTQFVYVPHSATPGATFTWSRAAVPGIFNAAASGSDTISEVLHDTLSSSVLVTYIDTIFINGCSSYQAVNVLVNPTPRLSSTLANTVCDSSAFAYVPGTATLGATFAWTRPSVLGISNPATSGSGGVLDTLVNTTPLPIDVTYIYTLTAASCPYTQPVTLTVAPMPKLSSSLFPASVCSGQAFTYLDSSLTPGVTYSWSRAADTGISNLPTNGIGNITETLIDTTNHSITVVYIDTLNYNSCINTQPVTVVVKPAPRLLSAIVDSVCSGVALNYHAISSVPGSTFSWTRPAAPAITPLTSSGDTSYINDTLYNSTHQVKHTSYLINLGANGCTSTQALGLVVNPSAPAPAIAISPASPLCFNTQFQNFGAATPAPDSVVYTWSATNATIFACSPGHQNSLISFDAGIGTSVVTLAASIPGIACYSKATATYNVTGSVTNGPETIYYVNGHFICTDNTVDSYQWGYDVKATLDSNILAGQIDQDYYNPGADLTLNSYWVITQKNGCMEKSYYNAPVGVNNINSQENFAMKLYPNPANNTVTIELSGAMYGDSQIRISDMAGRVIRTLSMTGNTLSLEIADLVPGCYFIECFQAGTKTGTLKLIKQ